jgi:predicted permease
MSFYRLLLRLYPAAFRHEYAEEMAPLFARRLAGARGLAKAAVWIDTIRDVLANAAGAHVDLLKQDLVYTARVLRRAPGFAVMAILIVALGIGATTAAFSVTDAVLLRPLPFPEPDRLVKLWSVTPGYPRMELSPPNYRDWKHTSRAFSAMGAYYGDTVTMMVEGEPRRFRGATVSAGAISALGVAPLLGRTFVDADNQPGAPRTVILSYQFWQREHGGDPGIVGRVLTMDDDPFTVVGVMPSHVFFPRADTLLWTAMRLDERAFADSQRTNNLLNVIGRLRPGVTLAQARAEAETIAAQWRAQFPKENKDTGATVFSIRDELSERSRLLLIALLGAAGCLLLIACANLANLLLARAMARQRELAVRAALGAGRERLVRQLMTESLLLAGVGGSLGVGLAVAAVPLLARLAPNALPIAEIPSIDVRVLLFAVTLTALTGIAFGLAPLVVAGRAALESLKAGARSVVGGRERLRSALVVAEIAVTVVLLGSAGLLIRALLVVQSINPGFDADSALTMRLELPMPQYNKVAAREALYNGVREAVSGMPGVVAAGFIGSLPMSSFRGGIWPVTVKGEDSADVRTVANAAALRYVTPGFFQAMGTPIRRGRDIIAADTRDRPFVAVVSESFARRYWPNQDPIGRRFTFASAEREIVGVVPDMRFRGLERESEPQVYLASPQVADGAGGFYAPRALAIRTRGDAAALAPMVRQVIRRLDSRMPITEVRTLRTLVELETESRAVLVRVIAAFAAIAFLLAAVGLHGVLSYAVSQRTQEIGVRMALGAESRDILSMVLRRSAVLMAAGAVPGLLLAWISGRSMSALLAGLSPIDIPTLAASLALVVLMTIVGSLVPTRRALRVDPITALRSE